MKSINVKNIMEKGGLMIEALAMLGLIAVVTPTMYKKSAERTMEIEDINTATTIRTISNAAESYVSANYSTIIADMMTNKKTSRIVTIDNLREYLPYGFDIGKSLVNYGTPKIGISRPNETSNSLTTFVLFPAKSEEEDGIGQERTTRIASLIGANGGYTREVEVTKEDGSTEMVQQARGIGGIWSLNHNNMATLFTEEGEEYSDPFSNSIVTASSETIDISAAGETNNDKYLQRGLSEGEEGQTWRTAMAADLYMGGVADDGIYDGTAYMHSIRNIASLVVGKDKGYTDSMGREYGLYITGSTSTTGGTAFIGGKLIAGNQQFQVLENALGFLGTDSSNTNFEFELDAYKLKYGYVDGAYKYHFEVDQTGGMRVGYNNGRHNFSVSAYGDIDNYGNLNLAKGGGYKKVRIGTLDGGAYLLSGDVENNIGKVNILMNDAGNPRYNYDYTLNYGGDGVPPDYEVKVGADMQVFGTMGAYQLDANNVRASRLAVGSENVNDSKKWMEVDSSGVRIQDLNWGGSSSSRLIVKNGGNASEGAIDLRAYSNDATRISGLALNKNGGVELYNDAATGEKSQKFIVNKDSAYMLAGNSKVYLDSSKFNIGSSGLDNEVFTVLNLDNIDSAYILAEAPVDFYDDGDGNSSLSSKLRINGNKLFSDKGVKIALNPENHNSSKDKMFSYDDSAYVLIDFDTDSNLNNANIKPGTIYVRPGIIELESNDLAAYSLSARESTGTIIGRRFVDGSGELVNVLKDPSIKIDRNPATDKTDYYSISNKYYKPGSSINYYDTYMVNPKYTSVMHDIKLTTRAGARLSDVLPDFINKGIYVVRNSYGDKYVEGDLIPTEKRDDKGNLISPPYKTTTKKVSEGGTPGTWASPYAGEIPAPQCPPGYGRVVTLTPASFEVAQSGNISHYDNKWFVKRTSPVSREGTNQKLDGFEFAKATDSAGNSVTFSPAVTYVIGSNSPNVKPFSVQQSNWLKTHVRPTRVEGSDHVKSWSAFLGFIYMESEYGDLIEYLTKERTVKIVTETGEEDVTVQNPVMEYQEGGGILWNIFPVRRNSLDAYATVYCYFDRANAMAEEINEDSNLVADIGPLGPDSLGAETAYKLGGDAYIQRLNDPTLKYNEAW